MPRERRERKVPTPKQAPVLRVQTEHEEAPEFVAGGGEKNPFAPEHGRGMPGAGQFDFPVKVRAGDFGGDGAGMADAGAVWAAKARPFLGLAPRRAQGKGKGQDDYDLPRFHASYLPAPDSTLREPEGKSNVRSSSSSWSYFQPGPRRNTREGPPVRPWNL